MGQIKVGCILKHYYLLLYKYMYLFLCHYKYNIIEALPFLYGTCIM